MYRQWVEHLIISGEVAPDFVSLTSKVVVRSYMTPCENDVSKNIPVVTHEQESRRIVALHESNEVRRHLLLQQGRNQHKQELQAKLEERKRKKKMKMAKEGMSSDISQNIHIQKLQPESMDLFRRVTRGELVVDENCTEKVIRIFTSSTFKDTAAERNVLLERVYPKLKEFCGDYNYEFQVVDMRWGVRDNASDDHTTWKLCSTELKYCQQISASPCFVTFLSCRYGNRFLPSSIEVQDFELLTSAMSEDNKKLAEKWYLLDKNAIPPVYTLCRISEHFPNYLNTEDPVLKQQAQDNWWKLSDKLRKVLAVAASQVFTDPEKVHQYYKSVTEAEIDAGILQAKNTSQNCLWFKRNLIGLKEDDFSKMACSYSDNASNSIERSEVRHLLQDLCKRRIPACLTCDNIIEYDVPWDAKGINMENPTHVEYIEKFAMDFEMKLKEKMLAGILARNASTIQDPVYVEIVQHVEFCRAKLKTFQGRENLIEAIEVYLRGDSRQPLVLWGKTGCGKSAVSAVAARSASALLKDRGILLLRFLGTTPESSHAKAAVKSVCKQIRLNFPDIEFQKIENIDTALNEYLSLASKEMPMILVLDSLDLISPENNGRLLNWLPKILPPHVKAIVSTLPDEKYQCYQVLQASVTDAANLIEVPQLDRKTVDTIVESHLSMQQRTLTGDQMNVVREVFSKVDNLSPLYISVCLSEMVKWKSYTPVDLCTLKYTVEEAIQAWFSMLEKQHGQIFVKRALGYITASRHGLTDVELEDILSCDDHVLNDVYQYWTPPLRRLPPLLWVRLNVSMGNNLSRFEVDDRQVICWFDRQYKVIAKSHFLSDPVESKLLHTNMADYFMGKWANVEKPYTSGAGDQLSANRHVLPQPLLYGNGSCNLRKLSELPYHLVKSLQVELLKTQALCNFHFLLTKLRGKPLRKLQSDLILAMEAFPDDEDIAAVFDIIQLSYDALRTDPRQLALQIIARVDHSVKHGHIYRLLECAIADQCDIPVLKPVTNFLTPPGGALRHFLATNLSKKPDNQYKRIECGLAVYAIDISADKRHAVIGFLKSLELWDIRYGYLIHNIDTSVKCDSDLCQVALHSIKLVIASSVNTVLVYDFSTAELLHHLVVPSVRNFPCVFGEVTLFGCQHLTVYNGEAMHFYKFPTMTQSVGSHQLELHCGDDSAIHATPVIKCSHNLAVICFHDNKFFILNCEDMSDIRRVEVFSHDPEAKIDDLFVTVSNQVLVLKNASSDTETYDLNTGQLVSSFGVDLSSLYNEFTVTHDGQQLLAIHDNVLTIWDIVSQKQLHNIQHDKAIIMAASLTGEVVLTMLCDFKLLIWNTSHLTHGQGLKAAEPAQNIHLSHYIPGDPSVLLISTVDPTCDSVQKVSVLTSNSLQPLFEMVIPATSILLPVNKQSAIMLVNENLQGIDFVNKKVLSSIRTDVHSVWGEVISFNNRPCVIMTVGDGTTAILFDFIKAATLKEINMPQQKVIKHLEVSRSGLVAVFTVYHLIGLFVWDIQQNTVVGLEDNDTVDGEYDMSLFTACLSFDGQYLAMMTEKVVHSVEPGHAGRTLPGIVVWNLKKGCIVHRWHHKCYHYLNTQLMFNTDNLLIISTASLVEKMHKKAVYYHVWDVEKGVRHMKLKNHVAVSVSHSGRHVLTYCTNSGNGVVTLWDVATGRSLGAIFVDKIEDVLNSKILRRGDQVSTVLFRNGSPISTLVSVM